MQVTDVNPFDSFSARLRVAQQRARPFRSSDDQQPAAAGQSSEPGTIGVRLRFRHQGKPRAGEPFEALSDVQRDVGTLDSDGSARLRIPLNAQTLTVSVGARRRFRVLLAVGRDEPRGD